MSCISYYLLTQPATHARLAKELEDVDPLNLKWIELETRPYLWAVVHEALRLMPGLSQRSPRVAPEEDLIYASRDGKVNWVIPKGTAVSMTSIMQHSNEELFPNPKEFIADRWLLEDGKPNYALERNLISFGKGSRVCLGKE